MLQIMAWLMVDGCWLLVGIPCLNQSELLSIWFCFYKTNTKSSATDSDYSVLFDSNLYPLLDCVLIKLSSIDIHIAISFDFEGIHRQIIYYLVEQVMDNCGKQPIYSNWISHTFCFAQCKTRAKNISESAQYFQNVPQEL